MAPQFKKAVKSQSKARIGIIGPSGAGKTYTALVLAAGLGEKIALIDTEHGSASKYADLFSFDTLELTTFSPDIYIESIQAAGGAGYDTLIIDSLSHAWAGTGGALELVEKFKAKHSGNKFAAWGDITPMQNRMIEAILTSPCHIIVTIRSKMEYIQTTDEKGAKVVKKVGMQPVQRDGLEYEFDIVADMDTDHNFIISKTRCNTLDGFIANKPTAAVATTIKAWLDGGAPAKPALTIAPPPSTATEDEFYRQMADWATIHGYDKGRVKELTDKRLSVLKKQYAPNWEVMNGLEWAIPFQAKIANDIAVAHPDETPSEQPAQPAPTANGNLCSEGQQKLLHIEAKRVGWSDAELHTWLNVKSTKELLKSAAIKAIDAIKKLPPDSPPF
jgi:hypothetical protein